MALSGYSVPETLTDDAGNALKSITVTVTGPSAYSGTATTDATSGVLRLGPLPVGDYTVTYRGRSVTVPVVAAAADIQTAYDTATTAETPTGAQAKATAAQTAATAAAATDAASRVSAEATTRAGADSAESSARASADLSRLLPRGAWVTATAYAVNDEVTANGVAWRCVLAHTSGAAFSADPTKWERFGVGQVVTTAPSSPATHDLWYDNANDLWKRWSGTAWVANGSGTYALKDGVNITAPGYNAVGDAKTVIDGAVTLGAFSSPSLTLTQADRGKTIVLNGAGVGGIPLKTTIATVTSPTAGTVTTPASTSVASAGHFTYGTDNHSAIQQAITDAQTAGVPLLIPRPVNEGFLYDGLLTVSDSLRIQGSGVSELWGPLGGTTITYLTPGVSPFLAGSVIIQAALDTDGILVTTTGKSFEPVDFGVRFACYHKRTGNGITTLPAVRSTFRDHGVFGGKWAVKVHGHDGDHYGFDITNPIGIDLSSCKSFGGGTIRLWNDSSDYYYGNSVIDGLYGAVIAGGTAHGIMLGGTGNAIQLIEWHRPQIWIMAPDASLGVPTQPTVAQYLIFADLVRARRMTFISPDMESAGFTALHQFPILGTRILNTAQVNRGATSAAYKAAKTPLTTGLVAGTAYQNNTGHAGLMYMHFTATPNSTTGTSIVIDVSSASDMSGAIHVFTFTLPPDAASATTPVPVSFVLPSGWYYKITSSRASYDYTIWGFVPFSELDGNGTL